MSFISPTSTPPCRDTPGGSFSSAIADRSQGGPPAPLESNSNRIVPVRAAAGAGVAEGSARGMAACRRRIASRMRLLTPACRSSCWISIERSKSTGRESIAATICFSGVPVITMRTTSSLVRAAGPPDRAAAPDPRVTAPRLGAGACLGRRPPAATRPAAPPRPRCRSRSCAVHLEQDRLGRLEGVGGLDDRPANHEVIGARLQGDLRRQGARLVVLLASFGPDARRDDQQFAPAGLADDAGLAGRAHHAVEPGALADLRQRDHLVLD